MPYLVAEQTSSSGDSESHIIGYSYVSPYRERTAYRFTVENSVYIANNFEGKGIGGRLLEELIRRCKLCGFKQIVSIVAGAGDEPSFNLHTRLGFRLVGTQERIGFKFGQWWDRRMLQCSLEDD